MDVSRWIVIPKWDGADGFQHYKNRDPIWIKAYTRLLSDHGFLALTYHQRGLLLSIWLEYARGNRQLRDSTLSLARQLGQRVLTRDLEALNQAGFIGFSDSKPLAPVYHDASPEKEKEKKEPRARAQGKTPDAFLCPAPSCGAPFKTEQRLLEHLEYAHALEGQAAQDALTKGAR